MFAADSASSLSSVNSTGEQVIINIYENANKVFDLCRSLPICAMTAGIGNFGNTSISTLSKELRKRLSSKGDPLSINPDSYTMKEIAERARSFFYEEVFKGTKPAQQGSFNYWVAGYESREDSQGEVWRISIVDGKCGDPVCEIPNDASSMTWGGQPEAINRLLLGYGQAMPGALKDAGLTETESQALTQHIARRSQANLMHGAMPTSDAIELAEYLVETTKKFVKFSPGGNTVGGACDIATVTKHEGFKWISRKHYYKKKFNPMENGHV
ncbi:MAG: hypothetical protein L3J37_08110 [Rhodobacteraceae bacterium]|nr:hypothetical protein [Paracoccaceae bacterium]